MKSFKHFFFGAVAITCISLASGSASAQSTSAKIQTDTIKVNDMRCGQCESRINRAFKKMKGVSDVYTDVETGTLVISYEPATLTRENIESTVIKTGYGIGSTPGDPAARKALPSCCK